MGAAIAAHDDRDRSHRRLTARSDRRRLRHAESPRPRGDSAVTSALGLRHADRAAQAVRTVVAGAVRVLGIRQALLVVVRGVIGQSIRRRSACQSANRAPHRADCIDGYVVREERFVGDLGQSAECDGEDPDVETGVRSGRQFKEVLACTDRW